MKKALMKAETKGHGLKRGRRKTPVRPASGDESDSPAASSGEDTTASPAEAVQSTPETKRRQAERKLQAMCAAFWGEDEDTGRHAPDTEENKTHDAFSSELKSSDPVGEAAKEGSCSALAESSVKKKRRRKAEMGNRESPRDSADESSPPVNTHHSEDASAPCHSRKLPPPHHEAASTHTSCRGKRYPITPPVSPEGLSCPAAFHRKEDESLLMEAQGDTPSDPTRSTSTGEGDILDRRTNSVGRSRSYRTGGKEEANASAKGKDLRKEGGKGSSKSQEEKGKKKEDEDQAKAKLLFDETVRDIRKLVYPHLGAFQQRQYFSTALRALGTKQPKGQRMPLPELRSRQASTRKNIAKRMEEERRLGVSMHVDRKGNLQAGERQKKQQRDHRRRRHRFRDILANAGRVDKRVVGKLGLKRTS